MKLKIKQICLRLRSLKLLLVSSFVILMAIAGSLGFILTSVQSQRSMNDMAEMTLYDLAYSVSLTIQDKIDRGHELNIQETRFFTSRKVALNDWSTVWNEWRPIAYNALQVVQNSFAASAVLWLPDHGIIFSSLLNRVVLINLNGSSSVCNGSIPGPGPAGPCNLSTITGMESFPMNNNTSEPTWTTPSETLPSYDITQQSVWRSGVLGHRTDFEASSLLVANNTSPPNIINYAEIEPFYEVSPPVLGLYCNLALFNSEGTQIVGQVTKALLLTFLGKFLESLTRSHRLLKTDGRAFVFELGNGLLTGASHGPIYQLDGQGKVQRLTPQQSSDQLVSEAGKALAPNLKGRATPSTKVRFYTNEKDFLCHGEPLLDPYGLTWMVAVVLSLTDLFHDINEAAKAMAYWTALAIILLSFIAGLSISFGVARSLDKLSKQMARVADMNLERVETEMHVRSHFYELARMQDYFCIMVQNLKGFRAFLPSAILDHDNPWDGFEMDDTLQHGLTRTSSTRSTSGGNSRLRRLSQTLFGNESPPRVGSPNQGVGGASGDHVRNGGLRTTTSPPWLGGRRSSSSAPMRRVSMAVAAVRRMSSGVALSRVAAGSPIQMFKDLGSLTKRSISMLFVDMNGVHRLLGREGSLVNAHSAVMHRIAEIVTSNGGMSSPIVGDRLMAFWNVRNIKSDHAQLCVASAMDIYAGFRASGSPVIVQEASGSVPCTVRVACSSGVACFGTLGTETSKAFAVISACIPRAMVLEKLGKLIPFGVACDGAVQERIQYHFVTRPVGFLAFPDRVPEHRIFEIMSRKMGEARTDEWMYELQQQETQGGGVKSNPFAQLRTIYGVVSEPVAPVASITSFDHPHHDDKGMSMMMNLSATDHTRSAMFPTNDQNPSSPANDMKVSEPESPTFHHTTANPTPHAPHLMAHRGSVGSAALSILSSNDRMGLLVGSPRSEEPPNSGKVVSIATTSAIAGPSSPTLGNPLNDPLLGWYRTHAEDVRKLIHPKWGMTIPIELLVSFPTSSNAEEHADGGPSPGSSGGLEMSKWIEKWKK